MHDVPPLPPPPPSSLAHQGATLGNDQLGRSAGHIPDDGAVGAYVQSAAIVYNHYRLKSLEESIERRGLRRDATFGGGEALTGAARSQFIQRGLAHALAGGFLTLPQPPLVAEDTASSFFRAQVQLCLVVDQAGCS
jgi:hypothetical protein